MAESSDTDLSSSVESYHSCPDEQLLGGCKLKTESTRVTPSGDFSTAAIEESLHNRSGRTTEMTSQITSWAASEMTSRAASQMTSRVAPQMTSWAAPQMTSHSQVVSEVTSQVTSRMTSMQSGMDHAEEDTGLSENTQFPFVPLRDAGDLASTGDSSTSVECGDAFEHMLDPEIDFLVASAAGDAHDVVSEETSSGRPSEGACNVVHKPTAKSSGTDPRRKGHKTPQTEENERLLKGASHKVLEMSEKLKYFLKETENRGKRLQEKLEKIEYNKTEVERALNDHVQYLHSLLDYHHEEQKERLRLRHQDYLRQLMVNKTEELNFEARLKDVQRKVEDAADGIINQGDVSAASRQSMDALYVEYHRRVSSRPGIKDHRLLYLVEIPQVTTDDMSGIAGLYLFKEGSEAKLPHPYPAQHWPEHQDACHTNNGAMSTESLTADHTSSTSAGPQAAAAQSSSSASPKEAWTSGHHTSSISAGPQAAAARSSSSASSKQAWTSGHHTSSTSAGPQTAAARSSSSASSKQAWTSGHHTSSTSAGPQAAAARSSSSASSKQAWTSGHHTSSTSAGPQAAAAQSSSSASSKEAWTSGHPPSSSLRFSKENRAREAARLVSSTPLASAGATSTESLHSRQASVEPRDTAAGPDGQQRKVSDSTSSSSLTSAEFVNSGVAKKRAHSRRRHKEKKKADIEDPRPVSLILRNLASPPKEIDGRKKDIRGFGAKPGGQLWVVYGVKDPHLDRLNEKGQILESFRIGGNAMHAATFNQECVLLSLHSPSCQLRLLDEQRETRETFKLGIVPTGLGVGNTGIAVSGYCALYWISLDGEKNKWIVREKGSALGHVCSCEIFILNCREIVCAADRDRCKVWFYEKLESGEFLPLAPFTHNHENNKGKTIPFSPVCVSGLQGSPFLAVLDSVSKCVLMVHMASNEAVSIISNSDLCRGTPSLITFAQNGTDQYPKLWVASDTRCMYLVTLAFRY